jgi:hypothetical protein
LESRGVPSQSNDFTATVSVRGVKNVLSDLSERLGAFGHSLGRVLSESVSQ